MMREYTQTFLEHLEDLGRARRFWGELGYNLAATRIGFYERELSKFIDMGAEGRRNLNENDRAIWFLRLSEIKEFLYIFHIVQSRPHLSGAARIGAIFGGPELPVGEASPTLAHPRNTFLEVLFAAHLEAAGLSADLSDTTDVKTVFKGVPIYVECKRPQGMHKAETAIRKAGQQLAQRVSPDALGIVLLCAGKLISGGDKWFAAEDIAGLERESHNAAGWVLQETARFWQSRQSISALMVRVSLPGVIKGEGRLCHTTTFRTVARQGLSASAVRLLDEFDATFHSGFPGKPLE